MDRYKGFIIGSLCGDGHVMNNKSTGNYGFTLYSKDLDYIQSFQEAIFLLYNKKSKIITRNRNGRTHYITYFYSKKILSNYAGIITTTKEWKVPEVAYINKEFRIGFLRGIFDSEGSVCKPLRHWRNKKYKSQKNKDYYQKISNKRESSGIIRKIKLFSINLTGLNQVKDLLKLEDITSQVIKLKKYSYIEVQGLRNCITFYNNIGFSIKRKNDRLNSLIELRNHRNFEEVNNISY